MLTKKKLFAKIEELERDNVELRKRIIALENMHALIAPIGNDFDWAHGRGPDPFETYTYLNEEGCYDGRWLTTKELKNRLTHPFVADRPVQTKNIHHVTFSELAAFVLDGKPIERIQNTKSTRVYSPAPGGGVVASQRVEIRHKEKE